MFGGYSTTRNEMCGATILYYPRHASGFVCASFPDPSEYVPIFGGQYIHADYPINFDHAIVSYQGRNKSIYDFIKNDIDWDKGDTRVKYRELSRSGKHVLEFYRTMLNSTDLKPEFTALIHRGFPNITVPYASESNDSCRANSSVSAITSSPSVITTSAPVKTATSGSKRVTGRSAMIVLSVLLLSAFRCIH